MSTNEYRLGIDLGTNSIGWAAVELDGGGKPVGVLYMGVRIFADGRDERGEASNAAERRSHEAVRRSAKERANGMESHWALFKRGFAGAHHRMSVKRLWRYANEFAERHNLRPPDAIDRMGLMAANPDSKRLKCKDLIGPKWTRQPLMLRGCV